MENLDVINIAEFNAAGKEIPRGRRYAFQIDRKTFVTDKECLTGRELLTLAGKTPPERHQLNQLFRFGRVEKVELDEKVDLATCGVERFATIPLDQTEGRSQRSDFSMPETDREHLSATDYNWETVQEGSSQWLIIRDFLVPEGYNVEKVDVALMIPPGYPSAQIDMAYFHPPLARTDGRGINALSPQSIEDKNYQRWSRHRTSQNPWRPDVDDVSTHLSLVRHWLEREFNNR
jgi:hypothetical protein